MKCQFCQQRMSLVRRQESIYRKGSMIWRCTNHPVQVLHYVVCKEYHVGDRKKVGIIRNWYGTEVTWLDDIGREFVANWNYNMGVPCGFDVDVFHDHKNIEVSTLLELETHPTDLTPENIVQKMQMYMLFQ